MTTTPILQFAKQTKNGKFRAYARGCIELCEKSSRFAILERSRLEVAPKDIKRLEVLKPANTPSMGERHDMAIAKERRLEVASQPVVSAAAKAKAAKARENMEKEAEKAKKDEVNPKKKAKFDKKQIMELDESALKNVKALEEEDEVQEGIDWSESEGDDDDEYANDDDDSVMGDSE